jgi:hypothetical protein
MCNLGSTKMALSTILKLVFSLVHINSISAVLELFTPSFFSAASAKGQISTGGWLKQPPVKITFLLVVWLMKPSVEIHFSLMVFFIRRPMVVFPLFSNFQTKLNFTYVYTHTQTNIYIYIHIKSNMELNSIIYLYTSKSCV